MLSDPAGKILLGSLSDVASGPFGSIVAWGLALITMSDVGRGGDGWRNVYLLWESSGLRMES